ncbi:kinase-like domain-containing protein [Multifurca ochricompacta]|uniref:Kinase-like domain-containing protein n=1 Tax=Multifurca ochricompacta TaxID=376703 RepID=A0AAD4MAH0_9AGAM|nr:kinase-like domain-containing protein [Multifurca ochricompacta]
MSHALLLRLFLSPSFFSVHVALRYLMLYSDNIGITYYLTRRLREFTIDELRDVWGFICHLLVSRPSQSRALECFVMDISRKSTHIAMLTLWFMQASLRDFPSTHHNPDSFLICQRILLMCHELIFGDIPPPTTSAYPGLSSPSLPRFSRKRVKPHLYPALIGMSMISVEQGRVDKQGSDLKSLERHEDVLVRGRVASSYEQYTEDDEADSALEDVEDAEIPDRSPALFEGANVEGRATGGRQQSEMIRAVRTSPSLSLPRKEEPLPRFSDDPLGQLDPVPSPAVTQSVPFLPSIKQFTAQVQFILNLESISNRVVVVPRPARVSALRAELTALNHRLPAEVCMPLWCSSADEASSPQSIPSPHHRIVRIPPGECVVLNSAERAPYLLVVEIIHGDLDFDPNNRHNKSILQKIVAKESEKKGTSKDLIPFSSTFVGQDQPSFRVNVSDAVLGKDTPEMQSGTFTSVSAVAATEPVPLVPSSEEEEEIDLIEQLYGDEESLRSRPLDISDSIVLRPTPKNKDLDLAAWSRSSSQPATPSPEQSGPGLAVSTYDHQQSNPGTSRSQNLTLEDYSERMRTAAVMLSQLNASLVWEHVSLASGTQERSPNTPGGPSKWLPGSSWFTVVAPQTPTAREGGPLHPSLVGVSQEQSASHPQRMKLQPSEAAAIRSRIMNEMLALEEERVQRMRENRDSGAMKLGVTMTNTMEDEGIIRRELNKIDPSAVVFSESWAAKKSRVRQESPYGHLANWDCLSVIVKTGGDLLVQEFKRIWKEENCQCWARHFRILITGGSSGLVETITDAVSIHSIKKAEYARRLAEGRLGHVSLMDYFKNTYGDPSSAKFARAQRNFAKSLAGYSVITYLLQIKDRHNGNILLDRDAPLEYVEILGGTDGEPLREFRKLFHEGFEAARKHCDRVVTMVELMQKDSTLPCFAASGDQTAAQLRERFQQALTHSLVAEHVDKLIDTSLGSTWTRLYDSYQYYSQSIL